MAQTSPAIVCDICGSTDVVEILCKLVCRNCKTILQSCADLAKPRAAEAPR